MTVQSSTIAGPPGGRLRATGRISGPAVLPPGAAPVAIGLCLSGAGAYAFLALASHELSARQYAPLATFWSLTFLLGPGSFSILERETGRRVAVGLEQPSAGRKPLKDVYTFALAQVVVFAGLFGLGHSTISSRLFNGEGWLVLAAALSIPSIGVQYLSWGVLAGNRKFAPYGMVNAMEGISRLAGCAALLLVGVRSATEFGFVVALAPACSVLFALRALRSSEHHGAPVKAAHGISTLGWLLGSSFAQAFLVNVGPLLVKILSTSSTPPAQTGRFLSGLVLVRIPLFLYNAASATLMPQLASAAARHQWSAFRSQLDRLSLWVLGLGAVCITLAVTVGPAVLRAVFGSAYGLDRITLGALAVATSLLLVTSTWSVALTATGAVRYLFGCCAGGLIAVFVPIVFVHGLFVRVELGLVLGALVAAAGMAAGLYLPWVPRHATRSTIVEGSGPATWIPGMTEP